MGTLFISRKNLFLLFSFLFIWVVPAFSQEFCARVVVVIGEVRNQEGREFKRGQKISRGEEIRTAEMSFAKLMLRDGSMLDIGVRTRIRIAKCESEKLALKINLEMQMGTLRAVVKKNILGKRKEFKVKTATTVLGVRGTEFFVRRGKSMRGLVREQISVKEGQVEIRSLFDRGVKPVLISGGLEFRAQGRVRITENQVNVLPSAPPQVDQFTASEQREAEQSTKIDNPVFENSVNLSPEEDPEGEKAANLIESTSKEPQDGQRGVDSESSGDLNVIKNPGSELDGNTMLNSPIPVSVPVSLSWGITK